MKEKRRYSAAAHHEKKGFIITGGYDGSRRLASTEITKDGVTFEHFSPLPIALQGHCVVALNEDDDGDGGDFFVAGGASNSGNSKRAFIHKISHWWVDVAEMSLGRRGKKPSLEIENEFIYLNHFIADLMCGPVRASPGGRIEKIVAAGGWLGSHNTYRTEVEIYDITGNAWATGA